MSGKTVKVDAGWTSGMNTLRHPWLLQESQYRRGLNIVNRGGVAQTRPGFAMRLILPAGNLQGIAHFQETKNNTNVDYLVAAVNGLVYAIPFPLAQPRDWSKFQLPQIGFDPNVNQVHFCVAQKTLQTLADSTLQIVPTYNVLMMQDGLNAAAYWDGEESRHLSEAAPTLETPRGNWMTFSGNRLWVARDKILIAGDLLDPLKFTERTAGIGRGDFAYPKTITGLTSFIGDSRTESVIIFTESQVSSLNSGVKDRTKWASTGNFQTVLFPSIGCVAGNSIVFQAGLMWWYAEGGLVSSDSAASSYVTSQITFKDAEMAFSKQFLADDQSGICGLSFENYLLMSLPIGQNLNAETFVLDYSVVGELLSDKQPAWSSVWTGIRPMQWVSALIGTKRRAFCASVDYTALSDGSHNHIWEAFVPERQDTFFELEDDFTTNAYVQPIYCEFETRLLGDGPDLKQFSYAEVDIIELAGDTNIRIDYRGRRGAFKQIACKKMIAPIDLATAGIKITADQAVEMGLLRKQTRKISTQEGDPNAGCPTCESPNSENVDKAFSLLVRWCGQLAVESVRVFLDAFPETVHGVCEKDETKVCLVDEGGQNQSFSRIPGFVPIEDQYTSSGVHAWISKKSHTETLACGAGSVTGPISVTAVSSYKSRISQADADTLASAAAAQSALSQIAYLRTQYPCFWDSVEYVTRSCYATLNAAVNAIIIQTYWGIHIPSVNPPSPGTILGGSFWRSTNVGSSTPTIQGKIARRNPDGTPDVAWAVQNGFLSSTIPVGSDEPTSRQVTTMSEMSGGYVMIFGEFTQYTNQSRVRVCKLLPTGEIDPTAVLTGGFDVAPVCSCWSPHSLTDMVIVGGSFTSALGISVSVPLVRVTAAGTLDGTFTPIGFTKVYAVAYDSVNDKIVVVGYSSVSGKARVVRLTTAAGAVDGTFTAYEVTTSDPGFASCAIQADQSVVVSFAGANSGKNLVRLTNAGVIDAAFNVGTGLNLAAKSLKIRSDGAVFLGGAFTTYNSLAASYLLGLTSTGGLLGGFTAQTFAGGSVNTLVLDEISSMIHIGGSFTSYNGTSGAAYWARIDYTGALISNAVQTTQGGAARSSISQVDANTQALALANQKAVAALPCA
jgi:hypothetical protein